MFGKLFGNKSKKLVQQYMEAAQGGDAKAMNNLGSAYVNGQGVGQDDVEGVE